MSECKLVREYFDVRYKRMTATQLDERNRLEELERELLFKLYGGLTYRTVYALRQ